MGKTYSRFMHYQNAASVLHLSGVLRSGVIPSIRVYGLGNDLQRVEI